MKIVFCTWVVFFYSSFSWAADFVPYPAYIDSVEEGEPVQVFSKPGQNWKYCKRVMDKVTKKERCTDAVGWPSRDAKITVLGPPETHDTTDPFSDKLTEEQYVKVRFSYERLGTDGKMYKQEGEGYIEMYRLSRSAHNPFYGAQSVPKKIEPPCPPDSKNTASKPLTDIKKNLEPLTKQIEVVSLEQKASQLGKMVGFCPFKPPQKYGEVDDDGNTYDNMILPKLKQMKLPKITKEDGKQMSQADLINIDALARTLYGEIGICYKNGLHYPMAVAKIAINRSKDTKRRRTFIQPPHDDDKPALAKALTTPSQFSMWQRLSVYRDKKTKKKIVGPNPTLHQGLCPPQNPEAGYYKSDQIPDTEQKIWENTMRIATEAILYPAQFEKRTAEITPDIAHYTSDLSYYKTRKEIPKTAAGVKVRDIASEDEKADNENSKPQKGKKGKGRNRHKKTAQKGEKKIPRSVQFIMKMDQVHPKIDGRAINENACLEIWKDK